MFLLECNIEAINGISSNVNINASA